MVVRLSRSCVGEEEKEAVARVIEVGYLGMGEEVRLFEEELAAYLGTDRHVVCVATGTAALQLAIGCLDIGPGDEVLIPTMTYVASFQAVSATGARPVACEARAADGFLDVSDAERRITDRTRAIMPVHYASGARGLDEVYTLAQKHGLRVIEDAAHAFGGMYDGKRVGATGDVICFSFDGIKNITCGEGGALVTADGELAQRARDARLLGVEKDTEARFTGRRSWTFDVRHQGHRFHMSNIMAAIGREQLKKIDVFSARRRALTDRYRREFSTINALATLDLDWADIVPHIFVIRVLDGSRDALIESLKAKGIESGLHYQPNHQLSLFKSSDSMPVAEAFFSQVVSLPLHAGLTDSEQTEVIAALRAFFQARS